MCTAIPESLARRQALAFAGFKYRAGAWIRGTIELDEELLDHLDADTWQAYLGLWQKGDTMQREQWGSTVAERLTSPRQMLSLDSETGVFKGYASVFNSVVQSYLPTIIQPGSFRDSLARRPQVPVLWAHDDENPVAVTSVLREDAVGLYVEGQMILEDPQVRGYWARVKSGAARGLSIGFNPGPAEIRGDPPTRYLSAVDLMELSICVFPADSQAYIRDVQARGKRPLPALLHAQNLRDCDRAECDYGFMIVTGDYRPRQGQADPDFLLLNASANFKSSYAVAEQRPSPEREYWQYVAQVKAQGRQIYPDGSFTPVSTAEAAYGAPLWTAVQRQRQARIQQRLQGFEEGELGTYNASVRPRRGHWHIEAWNHD